MLTRPGKASHLEDRLGGQEWLADRSGSGVGKWTGRGGGVQVSFHTANHAWYCIRGYLEFAEPTRLSIHLHYSASGSLGRLTISWTSMRRLLLLRTASCNCGSCTMYTSSGYLTLINRHKPPNSLAPAQETAQHSTAE